MQFIVVYTIECSAAHPQALRVMMAMEGMATLLMMKKRIMLTAVRAGQTKQNIRSYSEVLRACSNPQNINNAKKQSIINKQH